MRLDFNILWVDDQRKAVEAQCERIELQIRKEGFRLQVVFAASVEEARTYLSDHIYGDHIDLILMDYDLGAGGRGDDGLVEIRNIFPYKDIIFYSSQAPDLLDMVAKKQVQGVFCSTRQDLTDTVQGAFDSLVKKVLDIDHSRGIVMGATSDIDHYVNDCLISVFERSEAKSQEETIAAVIKHMAEKRKYFEKEAQKIEKITHVEQLLDKHVVYTSNDRLRLLKNALRITGSGPETLDPITKYMDETVPRRNVLAHVRVEVDGFSRRLIKRDGEELKSSHMRDLRIELLEYQEFMEQLSKSCG